MISKNLHLQIFCLELSSEHFAANIINGLIQHEPRKRMALETILNLLGDKRIYILNNSACSQRTLLYCEQ